MKIWRCCLFTAGMLLCSCQSRMLVDLGTPEAKQPEVPGAFKHAQSGTAPAPAEERWWKELRDPVLDGLMDDLQAGNPDLQAALARVDQANAVMGITGAQRFPSVLGEAGYSSERDAPNLLRFPIDGLEFERYRVAVNASWEVDLWGRVRASFQRERFRADVAHARYADVLLSLRATLARHYFALRTLEREVAILRQAVAVRQEAFRLQNSLADRGAGTDLDVARAGAELETARAEAEGLERTRGKLEHALAALTGRAPSQFELSRHSSAAFRLPTIPSGVPSTLLARRPDLRAAESTLLAASKQVGITKMNFLPRLSLMGTGGQASLQSSNLFSASDSFFFSLGPQIDVPLFQAGRSKAAVAEAKAQWKEASASYRAVLLVAVREVDDSLLDLQILGRQSAAQQRAVDAASRATALSQNRFQQGAASYFEVVDAQRTELQARRSANALRGEQAAATIQLIQALGGGW